MTAGLTIALAAGVSLAVFQLSHREAHVERSMSDMLLLSSALVAIIAGLLFRPPGRDTIEAIAGPDGLRGIVYFAAAGALNYTIAFRLMKHSQRRIGASRTSSLISMTPMFSGVFALIFLGEALTLRTGAGIVLVVIGAFMVARD